jgi:hypothetical protein
LLSTGELLGALCHDPRTGQASRGSDLGSVRFDGLINMVNERKRVPIPLRDPKGRVWSDHRIRVEAGLSPAPLEIVRYDAPFQIVIELVVRLHHSFSSDR